MSYEYLLTSQRDNVLTITLNRPKANALSRELMLELGAAIQDMRDDNTIRVAILTGGEGKFFAAGADIPTLQATRHDPMAEGGLLAEGLRTMDAIERSAKPIIAAVNGFALGGGCELALACHLRLASDQAVFGQPEINLGIIPGWGGMHRLPVIVGDGRAREWLLTGRNVSAAEALEAGLVSKTVPAENLMDAANELADLLAAKAPVALAETLRILRERVAAPGEGALLEREGFEIAARSQDAGEGIAAFLEKRAPNFTGN